MTLYLTVIIAGTLAVGVADGILFASPSVFSVLDGIFHAALATVSIIAIDGIFAYVIRRLPEEWFVKTDGVFSVTRAERRFYRFIKIHSWKDKIPELGGFTSFHKDKLASVSDTKYLERFILESNYGIIIHVSNAVLGVLIAFLPYASKPNIWIPIFVINFILSVLPVMILRYHVPVLARLHKRSEKT